LGGRRAGHLLERNFLVYRRAWMVIFSGFFEPLFYLFSIGVGLGRLVGDVVGPTGEPVSYAAFVAPALLGAAAMNGAVYESTFNIFFKLKYAKCTTRFSPLRWLPATSPSARSPGRSSGEPSTRPGS